MTHIRKAGGNLVSQKQEPKVSALRIAPGSAATGPTTPRQDDALARSIRDYASLTEPESWLTKKQSSLYEPDARMLLRMSNAPPSTETSGWLLAEAQRLLADDPAPPFRFTTELNDGQPAYFAHRTVPRPDGTTEVQMLAYGNQGRMWGLLHSGVDTALWEASLSKARRDWPPNP